MLIFSTPHLHLFALSADCLIFFARNTQISADGIINAHIQHSSSVSFCVICGLSHIQHSSSASFCVICGLSHILRPKYADFRRWNYQCSYSVLLICVFLRYLRTVSYSSPEICRFPPMELSMLIFSTPHLCLSALSADCLIFFAVVSRTLAS